MERQEDLWSKVVDSTLYLFHWEISWPLKISMKLFLEDISEDYSNHTRLSTRVNEMTCIMSI